MLKSYNRIFKFARKMSTHIDRTKDIIRDHAYSTATITKIIDVSPTIKHLDIYVDNENLQFKPGQWVDFHIPTLSNIGGFSMCSSPLLLKKENRLHLAVKYSEKQPAYWVHSECKDNDRVAVQVGGNFFYDITKGNIHKNLLLIAAGVGINPMYSIFKHISEEHITNQSVKDSFGKTTLLYTATSKQELIFKDDIDGITTKDDSMNCKYYVTKEKPDNNVLIHRRIDDNDLLLALDEMSCDKSDVICCLCGPETMMPIIKKSLIKVGMKDSNIRYESWW